jgi:hypothetical protein
LFPLLASAVDPEPLIARFSGHGAQKTDEFEVKGPWLLDWQVNSEFPELVSTVVRLEDAGTLDTIGIVADFHGVGNGLKVFPNSGRFRFDVSGNDVDWILEVREISDAWAARLERVTRSERSDRQLPTVLRNQVVAGAFSGWHAESDQALTLVGAGMMSFRVSFGPTGCSGLAAAKTLYFVTPKKGPQSVYDSILLEDGTRCYFDKVTWIPREE